MHRALIPSTFSCLVIADICASLQLGQSRLHKMGCFTSKQVEEDEKIAAKTTAAIDRAIKNDKKTNDRTVKILLLGMLCSTQDVHRS